MFRHSSNPQLALAMARVATDSLYETEARARLDRDREQAKRASNRLMTGVNVHLIDIALVGLAASALVPAFLTS